MSGDELLCFNGINGATGKYLQPPIPPEVIAAIARGEPIDPKVQRDLQFWHDRSTQEVFGVAAGIDPANLAETGWGVVFPHDGDPAIRAALAKLLDLRKQQATANEANFYQEFSGQRGYRPTETNRNFLSRLGVDPAQPADPARGVPYYLLLVGSPEQIPFRFQYQLDVQYAVGRIWFDTIQEYAQYADSVVRAESGRVRVGRRAVFFGAQNADDPATNLSATELVAPLAEQLPHRLANNGLPPWTISKVIGDQATKATLTGMLGGGETPSLLFTASHGMGFPNGDPRQLTHQGALLCQDWPGPRTWTRAIPAEHYFSADDVPRDANLQGLIACHFACYGAGTPRMDDFAHQVFRNPVEIAPHAFVARLPQRLLSHPNGGVLAVIGHVERAWGYSFHWNRLGQQIQSFESLLYQIMQGLPVGSAVEFLNTRYAALATELTAELEEIKFGREPDNLLLAGTWTAHNDARSFVVLGDPAVRLPLIHAGEEEARPTATPIAVPIPGSPAGGGVAPPPTATAPAMESPFVAQIAETEKRFSQRTAPPAFDAPASAGKLQRQNDPRRLRWRLDRIGVPPANIEDILRSGVSFQVIEGVGGGESDDRWLERIIGRNDLVDAPRFLERGVRAAQAVGRIRIRASSGALRGWGTGSLIAPRLVLTNNHVLGDRSAAAASLLEFRVEEDADGSPRKPVVFHLAPDDFFVTDLRLDFSLVAVVPVSETGESLDDFGWNPGSVGDDPILVGETVNIIQHPRGRPKQAALRDNTVTDLLAEFLHYRADTEPGSSGAPVFNDQWELVALHHSGVPKRDELGNILARDGSIWREAMGDQQIEWVANEGVRLSKILEFIRGMPLPTDTARQLRDGLLAGPRAERELVVPTQPAQQRRSDTSPVGVNISLSDGTSQKLTSPLTINISVTLDAGVSPRPATTPATTSGGGLLPETPTPQFTEAVSIDPDYENREGYDPEFLGTGTRLVPLPKLSAAQRANAARLLQPLPGADRHELKYHHYSVVMNRVRRLAYFTAVNIDGKKARDIAREPDKWFFDPRIRRDEQVGNELYAENPFDRGHLVRRLDPAWGRTFKIAKVANDDTFHFTNCSPQHEDFNQGKNLWQGVENFLLDRAIGADQKMIVFTGPVFRDNDPEYRGVRIPLEFWKVAALLGADGRLISLGFIVTQETLIRPVVEEAAIDTARIFQSTVAEIETLTGLDFGKLRSCDVRSVDSFAPGESIERIELDSLDQVLLPGGMGTSESAAVPFDSTAVTAAGNANPLEPVSGTDLSYYLIAFAESLRERADHPAGLISERVLRALASEPITDVFLFSHGWRGDVPSAREQYQGWLKVMAECQSDRQRIRQLRPGFRPLLVGLHWPSEPWGDETLADGGVSFSPGSPPPSVDSAVDKYAARLGDHEGVRAALKVVLEAARDLGEPEQLPDTVLAAYKDLDQAVGLPKCGVAGAPGGDWDVFDPEGIYQSARAERAPSGAVSFGIFSRDTLLAPLRVMSFWKMKDRARAFGENAVHPLLRQMQQTTAGRDVRFHLAGHSFGCIVASAAIAGPPAGNLLIRPVDSFVLLQGALSLWSYCNNIPDAPGTPGYFQRIISLGLVRGPIVTTQSRFDTAVGTWYPRAAWSAGQVAFAQGPQLPKYGAVGAFGIHGPGIRVSDLRMLPASGDYGLRGGQVYNVNGDQFINTGGGLSGAHSDIRKPEVGHLAWSAFLV